MKKMLLGIILWVSGASAQTLGSLPLSPLPGEHFSWADLHTPLVLVVFLSPECPICQGYSVTLNSLSDQYAGTLSVIGIFPGRGYTDSTYLAFRKKYAIRFTLIKDPSKALVHRLKATISPECFLLDASQHLLYQGAFDDKFVSLGRSRLQPTKKYLELAVADFQAGRPVRIPRTEAVGCLMNDY
jgi:thiol-disulfide isomerase/thioredoxin